MDQKREAERADHMKRPRSERESEPRAAKIADTERSATKMGDAERSAPENLEQCFGGLELHATASSDANMVAENLKRGRSVDNHNTPRPEKRAENAPAAAAAGRKSVDEVACRVILPRATKLQDPKTRCFAKLNRRFKTWPKPVLYIVHDYLKNDVFDQTVMGGNGGGPLGQGFRFSDPTVCICPIGPKLVVSKASVHPTGCAEWIFHVSQSRWSCGVVPERDLGTVDILQTHGIGIRTTNYATATLPQRDIGDKVIRIWLDRGTVRIFANEKEEFFAQVPAELFPVRFGIVCFFGAKVKLLEDS